MRAIIKDDMIVSLGNNDGMNIQGSKAVPKELLENPGAIILEYRWNGNNFVKLADSKPSGGYYIDTLGAKHIIDFGPNWPQLDCAFDAKLVKNPSGAWIVENAASKLLAAKERAKITVDSIAESIRAKVITKGDGQLATYLAQEAEAKLVLAADEDTPVPPESTPYLSALVGIIAPTLLEVAEIVMQMSVEWNTINAAINAQRLLAKQKIDAALSVSKVDTVVAEIPWPQV